MSSIYISCRPEETRMAVVNNHRLVDFVIERNSEQHLVSSIFKGRIANVVKSLQAAFVDLGQGPNGFLYLGDRDKATQGASILVQVTKDARSTKGPAVTRNITLPGRYVVLTPFENKVALSKNIAPKSVRNRIRKFVEEYKPAQIGLVVRTAAESATEEDILADINSLLKDWHVLEKKSRMAKAPSLLYRELDLSVRIVRDYITEDIHKIVIDDNDTCLRVKDLLKDMDLPDVDVLYFDNKEDIFHRYKLDGQIASISDRQVELPGGGYLVFDYTEAMTVVDVNSGKDHGGKNLEETIMKINKEAAVEIARQLRLRDIGGIIVVDFIDMGTTEEQDELLKTLRENLVDDKMKPKVQDITALNLVEITRRKARQNISTVLYSECPFCQGSGRVQSPETVCVEIRRRLRAIFLTGHMDKNLLISAHPTVAQWCRNYCSKDMEREFSCQIKVEEDPAMGAEVFTILTNEH